MIATTMASTKARKSARAMTVAITTTANTKAGIIHNPHYQGWDSDDDRIRPGRAYPHGRYEHVRQMYVARRFDYRTRHIFLYDNSDWVVASYDLDRCRDWQWDRDQVYVYDDDHHPGWYLLFNARLGRYVHVEYFGAH